MSKVLPYRDGKWLRKQLAKHGSLLGLCRAHGLRVSTVMDYLKRHPEIRAQIQDLLTQPPFWGRSMPENPTSSLRMATLKRHKAHWTVDELKAQGLPLYWDHDWLLRELRRLQTIKALADEHGYSPNTLRSYISRQPKLMQQISETRKQMSRNRTAVLLYLRNQKLIQRLSNERNQRQVVVSAITRRIQRLRRGTE